MNSPEDLTVVFAPHPDDDVIACGGTIVRKIDAGATVQIVFSTDGSRSHAAVLGIPRDPSPEELIRIRRKEAEAAARVLGVGPENLHFLGFTDTLLVESIPEFRTEISRFLSVHADVAEVYVPHGVRELNADHRLTGEVVLDCLADLRLSPQVFKYVVWDEETEAEFGFRNRGIPGGAAPATERLISVDIAGQLDRKLTALQEHKTQVTQFSKAQRRPVVPEAFLRRVCGSPIERFWVGDS